MHRKRLTIDGAGQINFDASVNLIAQKRLRCDRSGRKRVRYERGPDNATRSKQEKNKSIGKSIYVSHVYQPIMLVPRSRHRMKKRARMPSSTLSSGEAISLAIQA
jgi:hypothetical protein